MRHTFYLILWMSIAVGQGAMSAVHAQSQPGRSYYCTFNFTIQRPNVTEYISGAFQTDASQSEVGEAWTNYIRQTYQPNDTQDRGLCQLGSAEQQQRTEATRRQMAQTRASAIARGTPRNLPTQTVIHVDWKYASASSASSPSGPPSSNSAPPAAAAAARTSTPAPPPPPAAPNSASATTAASAPAAQGKIYFCTNTQVLDLQAPNQPPHKFKEYWSDVFTADAEQADITDAWHKYLVKTSHRDQTQVPNPIGGGCGGGENTVAFVQIQNWKKGARQSWEQTTRIEQQRVAAGSTGLVHEHTVIETGWKYTGGRVTHSLSEMSAAIRQLIDEDSARAARFFCPSGYDCTCVGQKVADYRRKEYEQKGDRIVAGTPKGAVLAPQLALLLSGVNPQLDLKSCARQ